MRSPNEKIKMSKGNINVHGRACQHCEIVGEPTISEHSSERRRNFVRFQISVKELSKTSAVFVVHCFYHRDVKRLRKFCGGLGCCFFFLIYPAFHTLGYSILEESIYFNTTF